LSYTRKWATATFAASNPQRQPGKPKVKPANPSNFLTGRFEPTWRRLKQEPISLEDTNQQPQPKHARRLFCSKPPLQTDSIRQNEPSTLTTMLSSVRWPRKLNLSAKATDNRPAKQQTNLLLDNHRLTHRQAVQPSGSTTVSQYKLPASLSANPNLCTLGARTSVLDRFRIATNHLKNPRQDETSSMRKPLGKQ